MKIVAVDPGMTVGIAWYYPNTSDFGAVQTTHWKEVQDWIYFSYEYGYDQTSQLIVEDFISAGHLSKEAKVTLKQLGYFELTYPICKIVVPQRRKAFVEKAREMCEEMEIPGPHAWDALAHCLAYAHERNL